ncbi:MAG: hypothetical protein ACKVQK_30435 [Burkholderiales bacterium]
MLPLRDQREAGNPETFDDLVGLVRDRRRRERLLQQALRYGPPEAAPRAGVVDEYRSGGGDQRPTRLRTDTLIQAIGQGPAIPNDNGGGRNLEPPAPNADPRMERSTAPMECTEDDRDLIRHNEGNVLPLLWKQIHVLDKELMRLLHAGDLKILEGNPRSRDANQNRIDQVQAQLQKLHKERGRIEEGLMTFKPLCVKEM